MARYTVTFDVEADDEQQVEAFAAYCADLPTDHKVEVNDYDIRCEGGWE